MFVSNRPGL